MPGPTIEVRRGRQVRIDWENALVTPAGEPAHLPFDVVVVPPPDQPGGASPLGEALAPGGRSTARGAGADAYPPVPGTSELTAATVTHLHGALTDGHSDGWAHNVSLPGHGMRAAYPNRQEAATLWYHDHAMAVTRFNVHAGLAGFYLIRDEREDRLGLPSGDQELTLAVCDRNLESAGQPRRNPDGTATIEFTGRLLHKMAGTRNAAGRTGEIPVSGPFTLVNGTVWPRVSVEPRWHRLRLLNGSNARLYRIALHDATGSPTGAGPRSRWRSTRKSSRPPGCGTRSWSSARTAASSRSPPARRRAGSSSPRASGWTCSWTSRPSSAAPWSCATRTRPPCTPGPAPPRPR